MQTLRWVTHYTSQRRTRLRGRTSLVRPSPSLLRQFARQNPDEATEAAEALDDAIVSRETGRVDNVAATRL